MNWTPVGDRILAKKVELEKVGSILLASAAKDQTIEAEVLAVGPEAKNAKAGQRVLFGKYAGMEYGSGEDKILLLRDEDIMAVSTA